MDIKIELTELEHHIYCMLDVLTGEKKFYKGKKKIPGFTGLYFRDEKTFFALYPAKSGPMMYYKGKEYPLKKNLHISLKKKDI